VDVRGAADFIGASEKQVLHLARDGKIPAHDVGCGMKRRPGRCSPSLSSGGVREPT
jgi:hypothetical protein